MIKEFYNKIKDWFHRSETILLARIETLTGAVVGVLSAIDWTPLMSMDFTNAFSWNQYTVLGGVMLVKGIISEWARKRNSDI